MSEVLGAAPRLFAHAKLALVSCSLKSPSPPPGQSRRRLQPAKRGLRKTSRRSRYVDSGGSSKDETRTERRWTLSPSLSAFALACLLPACLPVRLPLSTNPRPPPSPPTPPASGTRCCPPPSTLSRLAVSASAGVAGVVPPPRAPSKTINQNTRPRKKLLKPAVRAPTSLSLLSYLC